MIYGNIILDFDVIANRHRSIDVNPFADDAIFPYGSAIAHLGVMPDTGSRADHGAIRDICCGVDANSQGYS
jgi:hypothetical protein